MKIIVTFDFDSTLSRNDVQEYAKELMGRGVDVWVVTSRYDDLHRHLYPANPNNADLYEVTDRIGIERGKIRFTNMDLKSNYLCNTKVLWHLDDDWVELKEINNNTNTIGISVLAGGYQRKCNNLINKYF